LLGNRNWYLPRWLRWLPDMRIEGTTGSTAEGIVEDRSFTSLITRD
jgi:hypothetical protein